jgi:hypothetical protein
VRSLASPATAEGQMLAELGFRIFESMGLRQWDGTPKPALGSWRSWLARPLAP